jgi:hypothetical protein
MSIETYRSRCYLFILRHYINYWHYVVSVAIWRMMNRRILWQLSDKCLNLFWRYSALLTQVFIGFNISCYQIWGECLEKTSTTPPSRIICSIPYVNIHLSHSASKLCSWIRGFLGCRRRLLWWLDTNVSEGHSASIFRVEVKRRILCEFWGFHGRDILGCDAV